MSDARILLAGGGTGGHLYPALNLAEALGRVDPSVECFFLGSLRGLEASVLPGTGHPHRLLPLQPLHRRRPWRNWRLLASAPAVLAGVRAAFRDFRPGLVVGTGGYVSGPALAWARLRGTRTAIQEQNAQPGLATRLLARWVDQVHLGYPEAAARLKPRPDAEVLAFGNPVAVAAGPDPAEPGFAWPGGRTLLVMGGSQGARGLNLRLLDDLERAAGGSAAETLSGPRARRGPGEASSVASARPARAEGPHDAGAASTPHAAATLLADGAPQWPAGLTLVWIAGRDHAEGVRARVDRLPWADRIRVVPYIERLGPQLGAVSLALCRAGAMTVAELCAAGRPAVLVPLPGSAGGHQTTNARALEAAGAAEVREEAELRPGELWRLCRRLLEDEAALSRMAEASARRGRPDAALRIAEALLDLLRRGRA